MLCRLVVSFILSQCDSSQVLRCAPIQVVKPSIDTLAPSVRWINPSFSWDFRTLPFITLPIIVCFVSGSTSSTLIGVNPLKS